MDQTEPEDQNISWYEQKRCYDPDLDCFDYYTRFGLYEISCKTWPKPYSNSTITAVKPIQATESVGIV